jgi:hypothetical protein
MSARKEYFKKKKRTLNEGKTVGIYPLGHFPTL